MRGSVIVVYYGTGSGLNVLLAFTVTLATFLALTVFTMVTPVDWNFLAPFLFAGVFLLLFWSNRRIGLQPTTRQGWGTRAHTCAQCAQRVVDTG